MLRPLFLLMLISFFLSAFCARAIASTINQPDLVSIAGGYVDFDKTDPMQHYRQSADLRFEYRWGVSLLPYIRDSFKSVNNYIQVHPFMGVETTSLGALYGLGGFAMDGYIGRHGIFTWSEGVGLFSPGAMFPMGSVGEFRSQAELGWRFRNEIRVTAALSHISNDKMTRRNPGAEIADLYLHIPVGMLF